MKTLVLLLLFLSPDIHGSIKNQINPEFADADQAFQKRKEPLYAAKAFRLYQKSFQKNPYRPEAGWKFAMSAYYHGLRNINEDSKKIEIFKEGQKAGESSILASEKLDQPCAPCHFWTAINLALKSEAIGPFKTLFALDEVMNHLEKTKEIDAKYAWGGADRTLGLIYHRLPGILGGDREESMRRFEEAIRIAPDEPLNFLGLAMILSENSAELKRAIEVVSRGLKRNPPPDYRVESQEAFYELKDLLHSLNDRKIKFEKHSLRASSSR